jgi:hypothetical protein
MPAHKGPASLRSRCTRGGSSVAAIPVCRPRTGREGPEGEYRYSSTLSSTSLLHRGGSTPQPGRCNPGHEISYSWDRGLNSPQGRSGRVPKSSTPSGFDHRTVHKEAVAKPTELSRSTGRHFAKYTHIYIYILYIYIHVHTRQSSWKPNSSILEPDRPQHGRPAANIIAQQYSSATFV